MDKAQVLASAIKRETGCPCFKVVPAEREGFYTIYLLQQRIGTISWDNASDAVEYAADALLEYQYLIDDYHDYQDTMHTEYRSFYYKQ